MTPTATAYRGLNRVADLVSAAKAAGEPTALSGLRTLAADLCASTVWPTTKDEEWRRTRVSDFDFDSLSYSLPSVKAEGVSFDNLAVPSWIARETGLDEDGADIRRFTAEASEIAAFVRVEMCDEPPAIGIAIDPVLSQKGLVVKSIGEAMTDKRLEEKLSALLKWAVEKADNRFAAWNLAAWSAGVVVFLSEFVELARPVIIDWELSGEDCVHQPLLVVIAEKGARLEVIQRYHGDGGYLLNAGTYVSVGDAAAVQVASLQDCGQEVVVFSHSHASVGRDAAYKASEACLGSGFAKARTASDLLGPGADAHMYGVYFGSATQHIDLRTVQNHLSPHATSRSFYKGVVRDEARTIYQGLIYVAPHAPKTDAYLTNRNLVLNDGARADSIPSLQIQTDDVKCSHGSTTGRIDPEQVFYLANRGLSRKVAEQLIVLAYLDEVGGELPVLVRAYVRDILERMVMRAT